MNKTLLRGMRLAGYIVGQEETVGESSVSSGCWGEDSDHKYEWARRTPTFVAPIRIFWHSPVQFKFVKIHRMLECALLAGAEIRIFLPAHVP
jgi:hypothetical protein